MSFQRNLYYFFRKLTVHDVISMLEEDNAFQTADIFLEPPPVDELTDEDSGEEDGGGTIDNLNRHQLAASVDVTITRGGARTRITHEEETDQLSTADGTVSTLVDTQES
jgi:hypothetical protein